jgi:hypothetical protein
MTLRATSEIFKNFALANPGGIMTILRKNSNLQELLHFWRREIGQSAPQRYF